MTETTQYNSTVIVVGNRFSEFAVAIGAITLGEFLAKTAHELRHYDTVIVGQGIGWHSIRALYTHLGPLLNSGQLTLIEGASTLVSPATVHKHRVENVMITRPKAISSHRFVSQLVVDENCAELSDHISGIHMQGALFIEAARQMFMASSEQYAKELSRQNHVYTLQRVHVRFRGFLYPLPVEVALTIESAKIIQDILVGEALIQFSQNGEVGVEVSFKARAYEPEVLAQAEQEKAQECMVRLRADMLAADRAVSAA